MTTLLLALFACNLDNKPAVHNTAPVVTLASPVDGASFLAGETVTLTGEVSDLEDDRYGTPLTVSSFAGDEELCG